MDDVLILATADDPTWAPLIDAALQAQARAYAPYSGYLVGAAVRCDDETIVAGCNVENASFGGTICAERNAIWHAVALGRRAFTACVVVTHGAVPGSPCGMCRQVLAEFAGDLPILLVGRDATSGVETARRVVSLAALLPEAFGPKSLITARRW